LFPYIDTSNWHVGPIAFDAFRFLVAFAIPVGYAIAAHRAKLNGIGREHFAKLAVCVFVAGFLGGHLVKFLYSPESWPRILFQPEILLQVFNGQASFGSFLGGYIAAVVFLMSNSVPYRDWFLYGDAAAFALPFAWWIGRVGCYLVHDHPGIRTTSLLGVRYPGGTRYDLGLLEVFFLLALSAVFLYLDRQPRPRGFYYIVFLFSYGSFRFLLDSLHVDAPRYAGWTVDQIAASILIAAGAITVLDLIRLERARREIMPTQEAKAI
jgi:phosphatidylglycerol:prolipoprotein diacylglycerol transferase